MNWIKSSYSGGNGGDCVELCQEGDTILVRDSKDPDGPRLSFTKRELRAWVLGAKDGEFDHLT